MITVCDKYYIYHKWLKESKENKEIIHLLLRSYNNFQRQRFFCSQKKSWLGSYIF